MNMIRRASNVQYLISSSISRIYIRSMIEWRSRHQNRRLVGARDIVQVAVVDKTECISSV